MALVLDGFEMTVTLVANDDDGARVERQKTYEIAAVGADEATQLSNAQTEAAELATALAAITGAAISGYSLRSIFVEDALAIGTDNLFKEAVITVDVVGNRRDATIYIPAPDNLALLQPDGKSVDPTSVDLLAFLGRFNAPNLARISDGEQITTNQPVVRSRVRSVASGVNY